MKPSYLPALALGLALTLVACSDQESQPAPGGTAPPGENAPRAAPKAAAVRPATAVEPTLLPHQATTADDLRVVVPGGPVVREIAWFRNGTLLPDEQAVELPQRHFRRGDEITVEVVTDRGRGRASKIIGNAPPEVIAVAFKDPYVHAGKVIEIEPEGLDPDGDLLSFRTVWAVNGEILREVQGTTLDPRYFEKGDRVLVEVIPSDGRLEGESFVGEAFTVPNAPPAFVTEPPREFSGLRYTYAARAEDPDGDPLTYRLEQAPRGMTIDGSGNIIWPLDASAAGEHVIRIVARDSEGAEAVQEFTFRIAVPEG